MQITVELTQEQVDRLRALAENGGFNQSEMVGAIIDCEFEEWEDAVQVKQMGAPRATRWARFVASEGD